jgi:hypothetical protein
VPESFTVTALAGKHIITMTDTRYGAILGSVTMSVV